MKFTTLLGNAYRASLGKVRREKFIEEFQVKVLRPDGSVILTR